MKCALRLNGGSTIGMRLSSNLRREAPYRQRAAGSRKTSMVLVHTV
jgi:hypothetical protein